MKTMIYSLTLAALMITSFSSCSDDNDPVLTQKDWDGTTTYFASADAMKFRCLSMIRKQKISRLCIYRNTVRTKQALTTRYGR